MIFHKKKDSKFKTKTLTKVEVINHTNVNHYVGFEELYFRYSPTIIQLQFLKERGSKKIHCSWRSNDYRSLITSNMGFEIMRLHKFQHAEFFKCVPSDVVAK